MGKTYDDIVYDLILPRIPRKNGRVGGIVTADLGLVNGTQMVSVLTGGAVRTAVYLAPIALQIPGNVFVERAGPDLTAPLIIPASNFQVPVTAFGPGGLTTGGQLLTTGGEVLTTGV
jgi:hypothetical protein